MVFTLAPVGFRHIIRDYFTPILIYDFRLLCVQVLYCTPPPAVANGPHTHSQFGPSPPTPDSPTLSAMSAARSPQMPLTAIKTLSPASTALKMAHSMAVWPVPLMAKVMWLRVWNMYWMPLLISSMI